MVRTAVCVLFLLITYYPTRAAQFTVISNADSGTGSLREAITKAALNGESETDYILFNIPGGEANQVISIESELPLLTSNLIIDGTSQPGPGQGLTQVRITLIRASALYFHGLVAQHKHDIKVFGLKFANFMSDQTTGVPVKKGAIFISYVTGIQIGDINKENVFINNSIAVYSPVDAGIVENVTIAANLIGLEANGSPVPNVNGIDLSNPKNCVIGGSTPQHGNVVSGNINQAIGCGGSQGVITIQNNRIGVNQNADKVYFSDQGVGIFANGPGAIFHISQNVIGGQETGLLLDNVNGYFNITGNYIGTGLTQTENFKNASYGIKIFNCTNGGIIGGELPGEKNYIANNEYGIYLERNSTPVTITRNSIFCNLILGIAFKDLPVTPETPKITQITAGSASGTYLPLSTIELFYDDDCPNCEGKTFLASVQSDTQGHWAYSGTIHGNLVVTGTKNGTTSAFSSPLLDQSKIIISPSFCAANNGYIKNITVSDASVYNWYDSNGRLVGTEPDLVNVPAGLYQLVAGQPNGCFLKSPFYVVGNRELNYEVSLSVVKPATCEEDNGSITIGSFTTDIPLEFKWLNEDGLQVSVTRDLRDMPPGDYTLLASNGNSCDNIAGTFTIERVESMSIDLSEMVLQSNCDQSLAGIYGINVTGENGPFTFSWRDEEQKEVGNEIALNDVLPGLYSLTVTDKFGCSANSGLIDLTEDERKKIIITTAFTPNGDGINDTWNLDGAENYPAGTFKIYNRYGQKVFESRGYSMPFDGTKNNEPLPVGVYYYILNLNNTCPPLKGSLTILR